VTARRHLLTVAGAVALLLAWCAWPPSRAAAPHSTSTRHAAANPPSHLAARAGAKPTHRAHPPAPVTATAATTGIPACDDYVARSMACAQIPDDARIAIAEASKAWAELTAAGPQPDLEASCRATASVQHDALAAMGC